MLLTTNAIDLVWLQRIPGQHIQLNTSQMLKYHVLVLIQRMSFSLHVMHSACFHQSANWTWHRQCTTSSVATQLWYVLTKSDASHITFELSRCDVKTIASNISQVAGTEDGIKEPTATFSACFGAAFIMLHPTKYAAMLAEKMLKHGATGWLVNTGWSGGR